ncbi:MAG: type II toxin-antitoxin system RelE/ParE family toxin [Elusimicrobia bacterium]|nr:type II toxin-antitoxin system RelE/ParE family toxin [Elusimicrobiota bacterium]
MPHLEIHRRALKYVESLPSDAQRRIKHTMNGLLEDPFPRGATKVKGYDPAMFRIRVGDYRILYHVGHPDGAILVAIIDKRGRVYE